MSRKEKEPINARIPAEQKRALIEEAERRGVPLTQVIRERLDPGLAASAQALAELSQRPFGRALSAIYETNVELAKRYYNTVPEDLQQSWLEFMEKLGEVLARTLKAQIEGIRQEVEN